MKLYSRQRKIKEKAIDIIIDNNHEKLIELEERISKLENSRPKVKTKSQMTTDERIDFLWNKTLEIQTTLEALCKLIIKE